MVAITKSNSIKSTASRAEKRSLISKNSSRSSRSYIDVEAGFDSESDDEIDANEEKQDKCCSTKCKIITIGSAVFLVVAGATYGLYVLCSGSSTPEPSPAQLREVKMRMDRDFGEWHKHEASNRATLVSNLAKAFDEKEEAMTVTGTKAGSVWADLKMPSTTVEKISKASFEKIEAAVGSKVLDLCIGDKDEDCKKNPAHAEHAPVDTPVDTARARAALKKHALDVGKKTIIQKRVVAALQEKVRASGMEQQYADQTGEFGSLDEPAPAGFAKIDRKVRFAENMTPIKTQHVAAKIALEDQFRTIAKKLGMDVKQLKMICAATGKTPEYVEQNPTSTWLQAQAILKKGALVGGVKSVGSSMTGGVIGAGKKVAGIFKSKPAQQVADITLPKATPEIEALRELHGKKIADTAAMHAELDAKNDEIAAMEKKFIAKLQKSAAQIKRINDGEEWTEYKAKVMSEITAGVPAEKLTQEEIAALDAKMEAYYANLAAGLHDVDISFDLSEDGPVTIPEKFYDTKAGSIEGEDFKSHDDYVVPVPDPKKTFGQKVGSYMRKGMKAVGAAAITGLAIGASAEATHRYACDSTAPNAACQRLADTRGQVIQQYDASLQRAQQGLADTRVQMGQTYDAGLQFAQDKIDDIVTRVRGPAPEPPTTIETLGQTAKDMFAKARGRKTEAELAREAAEEAAYFDFMAAME